MSQTVERPHFLPRRRQFGAFVIRALAAIILTFPYRFRIRLTARVGSPLAGRLSNAPRKIRDSLADLRPDLPASRRHAIAASVLRNSLRTQVELLSGTAFFRHARNAPVDGPGLEAITQAQAQGRAVLLLVSHFGNSAAVAAALKARGIVVGTYFKPLKDPVVNRWYEHSLLAFTEPLFRADRAGLSAMQRFLRKGGMVTISFDLDRSGGAMLDFLGRPTRTALSIAEMALRRDALMIPVYGVRLDDGLSFRVVLDAPIAHSDPNQMMQAANDSLAAMVRAHPDQWLWWHQRWRNEPDPAPD